jgi:GNAT superfamily N-acetyltransferase
MFAGLPLAEAATGIAFTRQTGCPAAAVEQVAGGWAIFAGANSMLTRAIGLGLYGPVTAADIVRVEAFFRERGAPVTIDLCPCAHPSLAGVLRRRGYDVAEFNNVLVRKLETGQLFPEDARARECAPEDMRAWVAAVSAGFFERADLTPDESAAAETIFRLPGVRCFLGRSADAQPAAGAAMAVHEGLAAFFADSTAPAFRGAGLHSALVRARLNAAIRSECDLAMSCTLPGSVSQRNYEKLGFQVVYTRVAITA